MKRLYKTQFRRRTFATAASILFTMVLTSTWFYYNTQKHQLFEDYSKNTLRELPSIVNELLSSGEIPPLTEWNSFYAKESPNTSVILCDHNSHQVWTSIDVERRTKQLAKLGISRPQIDNLCTDLNFPIDTIRLVEKPSGAAFIVHTMLWKGFKDQEDGKVILTQRVEHKMEPIKQLKYTTIGVLIVALTLISALLLLFYRISFAPFVRLEKELHEIKQGKQNQLAESYPEDLHNVTSALNELLFQQKENQERYKRSLNDLAHSLKTRVAVSQALLDDSSPTKNHQINQQLLEMDSLIQGQLKRASLGVKGITTNDTLLKPVLDSLVGMFTKIYTDKSIQFVSDYPDNQTLPLSKDDLMEIMGNILENTYRFADQSILFKVTNIDNQIMVEISNDGPAIDSNTSQSLFQRGVRADQQNPGTGLGLALCDEIIHSYKGAIWFETPEDPSMGVSLRILLPQP
ncbi:two-component system, OmpR family, sensor histidine kinase PhoQ [Vibrio crassostreae]|uniref:histidine kinase n=2 Tax=Vibrio TaxID=662 RepID=A0A4R2FUA2_9VIBR|nr:MULTISPECIES: ATP-binding protein [Vibrio]KAA8666507.1 GHKL domain-containing protein [Vibrio gigantis]MDH5951353.1 ATP-binding protein [Vibrio crassostreae]MDL5027878.1 ATP-binding protein [Vibrio sp. TMPB1044]MDN5208006.1 ATP-binding protein [Vibrio sp. TMPB1044]ROO49373.1 two-component system sensor histidine kinase PhoQ [Vibrio crassostreae]